MATIPNASSAANDRRRLARAIHDSVLQRLCAVAIALEARRALEPGERDRCRRELDGAIAALRDLLDNDVTEPQPATLNEAVTAACDAQPRVALRCDEDRWLSPQLAGLIRDFAAEGVRNAAKHGEPATIDVLATATNGGVVVAVENDGASDRSERGTGLGLRSLELEALEYGGRLEAGPRPGGRWLARLELPV